METALQQKVFGIYSGLAESWHIYFKEQFKIHRAESIEEFRNIRIRSFTNPPPGFEDFGNGKKPQWIEPGNPALSVFFHALASPAVRPNGVLPGEYPSDAAIETVENHVFACARRSLSDVRQMAGSAALAIAVFAKQYRLASESTHRMYADVVFSRVGVARVGTVVAEYDGIRRCFRTHSPDSPDLRVLPCRYSAYIAARVQGNREKSIPGRFRPGDGGQQFWVPLHKLFDGDECLRDFPDLKVVLKEAHYNEKLRRIHRALHWMGVPSGYSEPEISRPPFVERNLLAAFCPHADGGSALLVPMNKIVDAVSDANGNPVTMFVPPNSKNTDSSFHIFPRPERWAPEFIYVRQKFDQGHSVDLSAEFDVSGEVLRGNYEAIHYRDYTGDGWIRAECAKLRPQIPLNMAAYSVLAPPDLLPDLRQADLMDWFETEAPADIKNDLWNGSSPQPLCDQREPANLELPAGGFTRDDRTAPAMVGLLPGPPSDQALLTLAPPDITGITTTLPDDSSGIFAPGSEIGQDQTPRLVTETGAFTEPVDFLSNYGMGSPFLEDTKLCAAQSSFWPGTTPDTARAFEPHFDQPTVTPLLDCELAWDETRSLRLFRSPLRRTLGRSVTDLDRMQTM